jgi:carboxyl-terminal processing protease
VVAALQDHARAVVVGERSYGKGSVQNIIPMEGGASALKLTTASYWRPSGKNIHRFPDAKEEDEWGVRPNKGYEVKLPDEERLEYYKWRRDRDVIRRPGQPPPKAKEKEVSDKGEKEKKAKTPFTDRVLAKALEYLRGKIGEANNGRGEQPGRGAELRREPAPAEVGVPAVGRASLEFRTRPEFLGRDELR